MIFLRTHSELIFQVESLPYSVSQIIRNIQALPSIPTPNHSSRNGICFLHGLSTVRPSETEERVQAEQARPVICC